MKLTTPVNDEVIKNLKAGDKVLISGTIYTARDQAHKRLVEMLDRNEQLPFDLKDQIIYYVGPTPAKENQAIGACGPTTSYRMDAFTPTLLKLGLKGMIGKGERNEAVKQALIDYNAVYFLAIGGTAALLSKSVVSSKVIAFEDLGAEAIHQQEVRDFPVYVVNDSYGNDYLNDNIANYMIKE